MPTNEPITRLLISSQDNFKKRKEENVAKQNNKNSAIHNRHPAKVLRLLVPQFYRNNENLRLNCFLSDPDLPKALAKYSFPLVSEARACAKDVLRDIFLVSTSPAPTLKKTSRNRALFIQKPPGPRHRLVSGGNLFFFGSGTLQNRHIHNHNHTARLSLSRIHFSRHSLASVAELCLFDRRGAYITASLCVLIFLLILTAP